MARKQIDVGVVGNDGTGDSIRDSFRKVNDNFRELYGALGLGSRLSFLSLDETPDTYEGQENAILAVNPTESGMQFKQIVAGTGIAIDFVSNENEIVLTNTRSSISADSDPRLGGNLQAQSGSVQYRIQSLTTPISSDEAVNKSYADSKISLAGVNARDPAADGAINTAFGTMTGPLILSRDPDPADDDTYGGLIAATKRYVDNAGFGSVANLYVATSGNDARVGVGSNLQGRALSYAFRSLEAALKKAEEIVKSSRQEIGPYKKVLTWTNPTNGVVTKSTLTSITESPNSGAGFLGRVVLTLDTIDLVFGGYNYEAGEILELNVTGGDDANAATIEILTVASEPGSPLGPVSTFRLLTGGSFDGDLPSNPHQTYGGITITSTNGTQATFNVTYKVSNAIIEDGGSDYSLVSVRVDGGGGTGAFGFADVTLGEITSVTITDGGAGFTDFPDLIVDLPRFAIYTAGQRTDFTGDVTTDSAEARRGRDIREGLFLYGETSGALAQILAHSGELDSEGNELFDIDVKYGVFELGEEISYGDVANTRQVAVFVESGIYYENLPLKVPQNVAIIGDEFRRTIIRPKQGFSTSPWAFQYFRRDRIIDGLNTSRNEYNAALEDEFAYHYLSQADAPVYPLVNNRGFFRAAAQLLTLNKEFIQEEVIAWTNKQITDGTTPFAEDFTYNEDLCKRDVGLIIDAITYDMLYGGNDRTVSAALKYRQNASGLIAITEQIDETTASIERINTIAQAVIKNIAVPPSSYLDPITGTLIEYSEPQIIDTAYSAESGSGGTRVTVSAIAAGVICRITTSSAHGLATGDIVTFDGLLDGVDNLSFDDLNGKSFWVTVPVGSTTRFDIFTDQGRESSSSGVNSTGFPTYLANSGDMISNGGVLGALVDVVLDIISDSGAVNYPLDNDQMDVFLMNDATIIRAMTIQGNGGFALVLDPEGQILAKSPYAQEGAVFSKSTGRQTFAGGMYVDGFAGNLRFKISSVVNPTRLTVEGLKRFPQLPASFIVSDTVYRINYVRDFIFNTAGSTATFVLDETTPWPFEVFTYNEAACSRDAGLILDGVGYDIVFGSNYHARKAGLTYRQANAAAVINDQLDLTVRAIEEEHLIVDTLLADNQVTTEYNVARTFVTNSETIITNIVRRGTVAAPNLSIPNPSGLDTNYANGKALLLDNIDFIKEVVVGYINTTYPSLSYESSKCARDIQYIVEAVAYDLTYGGNSQSRDAAFKYFDGTYNTVTDQLPSLQKTATAAGITKAKDICKQIVVNTSVSPTYGAVATQNTGSAANVAVVGEIETLIAPIAAAITAGNTSSVPSEVLPNLTTDPTRTFDTVKKAARTLLQNNKVSIQSDVIAFVDLNANRFEILMPGNRSMLSNDFTQINDMGYGLVTNNGGLAEAVSMFTYYNYTSYYSLGGGQIRSVGGSSAHGVYALAAEGSDPLEVPTPVDAYYEFSQGAVVYNDGGVYENDAGQFIIYVGDYSYPPRDGSEIEIDHGGQTGLVRYPVVSATTEGSFPIVAWNGSAWITGTKPLYRLNLNSDTDGLVELVNDGAKVTLRINTELVLTGGVVGVAVRPSTALKLNETYDTRLYRVLEFADYFVPNTEVQTVTISVGTEAIFTTASPHGQLPGYRVVVSTTGTLPTGLLAGDTYYILDEGFTSTTFKVSYTKSGSPIETTAAGSGTHKITPTKLAATALKDGYDYAEITLQARQPFVTYGASLLKSATEVVSGTTYTITTVGTTNWVALGAGANTVGTTFTASASGTTSSGTGIAGISKVTFDHTADTVERVGHGFEDGDVIRFESSGTLPSGIFGTRQYFVYNKGTDDFQVVTYPGSTTPVTFAENGTGYHFATKVIGREGDSSFAVVELGPNDQDRITGMKFNFKGSDYTITQYDNANTTGESYAMLYVTPALDDSLLNFESPVTLFGAVPARTEDSQGTLTIRISLTRVTSHDLLDIGTGSYADTNYPNEIYGSPVRIATETLLDTTGQVEYAQVVERGEGRCFFVTTDQFGNFSVGPFFRVDQGTGTVTFSASLALSNLNGLGFKRGVPIAEFSTDTSMSDNATDTVPTENATRSYIDRRLGVTHGGENVEEVRLIPTLTGGFMALSGQLPMKGDLSMGSITPHKITNLADPENPLDAVNLRSFKISNIQDFAFSSVEAGNLFTFTGDGTGSIPAKIGGDLTVPGDNALTTGLDSTLNELNVYIKEGIIDNANINASAAIAQSKLNMTIAATQSSDPSGTTAEIQAANGLSSFNSSQFDVTNGRATIKDNGVALTKIAQIATDTVLGNSTGSTANVTAVTFATVVDEGGSIKKNQFASSTGFIRRRSDSTTSTQDSDYAIVEAVSAYSTFIDTNANSRLVIRDSSGDFGGRDIYASRYIQLGTNAHGYKQFAGTTATSSSIGANNLYGYGGVLGIAIADGTSGTDRITTYRNTSHRFRNYDDSGFAPIQVSQIITPSITSGGSTTDMEVIGKLALSSGSTFNADAGTLRSTTLSTGAAGTAGTVTGTWSLGSSSVFIADAGTLRSTTLSTNANTNTGTITGNWSLSSGSKFNATAGTLQSTTLTTGATGTAGIITGQWSLSAGSTLNTGTTTLTTGAISGPSATTPGNFTIGETFQINSLGSTTQNQWNTIAGTSGQVYAAGSRFTSANVGTGFGNGTATKISSWTGYWNMISDTNLTLGTGYIDARTGTLYADTLTTGADGTGGVITGNWSLNGASNLTLGTGYIDARTGTLYADTLTTGATGTGGVITGAWTLASGSTLVASSIASQANSATTTATDANTGSTIVLRDSSGNFSAGTVTAALSGNASTSSKWATARTITLAGDLSGSVSIDGSGDVTLTATVATDKVALGTDTTGNYVATAGVSGNGLSGSSSSEGGTFTVTSNATSANTANTIVFRDASGNFSAGVISGTATAARYADLAERYAADKEYAVGTVVVFGGDKEITTSNIKGDTRVAGVISEKPAYLMNSEAGDNVTHPPVALQGRVPVRVVGKIVKGDILVCAGIHGVAIVDNNPKVGSIIGKALENYDSDHIGTIEVVVGRT